MESEPEVLCAVCGARLTASQPVPAASLLSAGSGPALDLRPEEAENAQLAGWVECCVNCGYCDADIAMPLAATAQTAASACLATDGYQRTLHDPRYPVVANRFRCLALLQQADKDPGCAGLAAMSLLYAAWVCDDAANSTATGATPTVHPAQAAALARQLRRQSAELLRSELEAGRAVVDDMPTSWLVLADVYRRAEVFPSAHTAAIRGLAEVDSESPLAVLLQFEQELISQQETAAVSIAAAFAGSDGAA